jgi:RHS repeat-associated protein
LTTQFTYNGDGARAAKTVNGVTTTYIIAVLGLPQVLVETTGGQSTAYLYGHDLLGEEEGSGWAWHLGDGLGSVRQLTDGAGDVTLAQGYTPFGVLLWSEGNATSAYGFTGEQEDPSAGLVFLRARYYDPATGRFLSKDTHPGDRQRPMTLNPYLYVLDNPVNAIDPTGLYHSEVHKDLTWSLVFRSAGAYGFPRSTADRLANAISWADQWVDDSKKLYSLPSACTECHFCPFAPTIRHVERAIESGNPYLFGASLHQLQDWFSHWNEGYTWEHAAHTALAKTRTWIKTQDFFWGWHLGPPPNISPFPPHPRDQVIQDLRSRNPELDPSGLSDQDLIDLFLRRDFRDPNWRERVEERSYFGLDPDKYVQGSQRDTTMEILTYYFIKQFLQHLVEDPCAADLEDWGSWAEWMRTSGDEDIKKLLTE